MLTHFTLTQPLSLDNALSSYQIIHKLITQMNKVIDEVNNIDSKANEYTDREIIKLHNIINTQLSELEELLQSQIDVNKLDITDLKNRANNIENELITINNKLIELREYIDDELLDMRNELNTIYHSLIAQMEALKQYVEELIKKMTVKVYSNYDGCKKDIKEAINDIYNLKMGIGIEYFSIGYIKAFLNMSVNYEYYNSSNYDNLKNCCTVGRIKNVIGVLKQCIIGKTYNPNPTDDNNFIRLNYNQVPTIRDLKLNFSILIYSIILNCIYDYNGSAQAQQYFYNTMCGRLTNNMYTYLGFGYTQKTPFMFGAWHMTYN